MEQEPLSQSSSRFVGIGKRTLLLALPFVLLFLLGEVAGRLLEQYAGYRPRRTAGYLEGNPYLRTALVPGMRFRSGPYRIDVNSLGFRGPEIAVPKPPETMRIFALGESSTFGWKSARSHEEAWPGVLETRLRAAHPGRRIEVINAGVPGYTSIEQRINFMLRISHLQADAILIYHGNNDLNWSWTPEIETKLIYGRADAAVCRPGWFTRLMEFSYVWMEVRSRIELFGASSRPKKDAVDEAAIRMLEENIRGLIEDAGRRNVKVAIATFAHGFDVTGQPGHFTADEVRLGVPNVGRWFENLSPEGARRSFPVYNEMVRSVAGAEKIPLAEPIKRIPPTPEYFTDWCHLTLKGEQLMAQIWFETLEEAGWFKSATPSTNP